MLTIQRGWHNAGTVAPIAATQSRVDDHMAAMEVY
jgi:hypothetical protein